MLYHLFKYAKLEMKFESPSVVFLKKWEGIVADVGAHGAYQKYSEGEDGDEGSDDDLAASFLFRLESSCDFAAGTWGSTALRVVVVSLTEKIT
jgi:hypothetical protein